MTLRSISEMTNRELVDVIKYDDNASERNRAWELLATKNPTNEQLTYIIRWCPDGDLKNRAWELLATKNPTNEQLTYIIRWCPDGDLKNRAGELLATKNPTNEQLTYIMEYCPDGDLKNRAWERLRANLGIVVPVDEEVLIKEIANAVLSRPGSLKMESWHCGTSHCLAGWACVLNPIAKEIESKHDTRIAGSAVLPHYAQFFYSDNDQVLEILKGVAGK
ncbi:hypothetical protein [Hufsiella ginkgonis]|uniref:Uncharacterized protein n=1 Tax=Hufsiella ginkgonis TaxID=2695274 RepID=A0A7K1Y0Y8_9SPHI|nr:hypothetical protein [Hufsiella ginkgonis]MXV16862.1 hypothetical protein [Hufsiella ginkgonis]